ncbi:hypothetical protein BHE90_017525 [Fusarium euwallaceae]|uniref:Uncharacterized protein n=1 Tax=Fusarium euwallaceae TaxID=1147111 RepID=A0A430KX94_9HYPO|nr:hypothetical protein BHE90_017525 [Fusarium euwallaceae]
MNAQDQADNLHASSIGPVSSLNDFDPTNHTVREPPEDLNQHDLDLQKNQEELSPSKSGRNHLRPAYARKSGSRRNRLRLAYARKFRSRRNAYARKSGSRRNRLRLAYALKSTNKDDSLTLFEVTTYLRKDSQKSRSVTLFR